MNEKLMSNRAGNNYNRILRELYNRYYKQFTRYSGVTAVSWQSIG